MTAAPPCPQPHFPSPYLRPSVAPTRALRCTMPDGAQIATFEYAGAGPHGPAPVLMLHGNGEEHGIFGPTIDAAVAAGHPVIALDSRAQGRSTRGSAPLTYELMAQDALRCLDELGVSSAHVLGFSDGAIEGLILARDHPSRVRSLLSIGANLTPEGVAEEDGWDVAETSASLARWARWVREMEEQDETRLDASLLSPTAGEAEASAELLQLMLDEPHLDAASLAAIGCPVTVMVGADDCIRPSETRAIVAGIRGGGNDDVRLVVVPDAGHTLPKHESDAVTRELLGLIRRA